MGGSGRQAHGLHPWMQVNFDCQGVAHFIGDFGDQLIFHPSVGRSSSWMDEWTWLFIVEFLSQLLKVVCEFSIRGGYLGARNKLAYLIWGQLFTPKTLWRNCLSVCQRPEWNFEFDWVHLPSSSGPPVLRKRTKNSALSVTLMDLKMDCAREDILEKSA